MKNKKIGFFKTMIVVDLTTTVIIIDNDCLDHGQLTTTILDSDGECMAVVN